MPQGVMGAFVEVDEDLLGAGEVPVGLLVPQNHRGSVTDRGYAGVGHRVVGDTGNHPALAVKAGVEWDLSRY
jgi:hypothetical protein